MAAASGVNDIAAWKANSPYVTAYRSHFDVTKSKSKRLASQLTAGSTSKQLESQSVARKTAASDGTNSTVTAVLSPGGVWGEEPECGRVSHSNQSSYTRAYANGPLDAGLVAASRDFGLEGERRVWLPPSALGVTHSRTIAHEPLESWGCSLQTSYSSMAPDDASLKKTLESSLNRAAVSREVGKTLGGPVPYEEAERCWRRWQRRKEQGSVAGDAASVYTGSHASTMPAGVERPRLPEEGFTRFPRGRPLLAEREPQVETRGPCGEAVALPAPHSEAKPFTVLLPTLPREAPREDPADPRWKGRFRSLMAARHPRISARKDHALTRRGEDLG